MDLTFLIPVKLETSDRVKNLSTVLCYLLSNFDAKVSVREFDTRTRFYDLVYPNLLEKFNNKVPDKLEFTYDIQDRKYFHKTRILNDLLLSSTTKVVCNYDTDVILPISSINKAYDMIINGDSDAVYPYGVGAYQKVVDYPKELYRKFMLSDMGENDIKMLNSHSTMGSSTIGWCQFISRNSYIKSFMMNEEFAAWGPEDCELFYRLNILGNKVDRINDYVYHLEHVRSMDSWFSNPSWKGNTQLWNWIRSQSKENLIEYYKNQDYIKRRNLNVSF